jgi:hypothetical protein
VEFDEQTLRAAPGRRRVLEGGAEGEFHGVDAETDDAGHG